MKKYYFYQELLKLAEYAAVRVPSKSLGLEYQFFHEAYVTSKKDLYEYNTEDKTGKLRVHIHERDEYRTEDTLHFRIVDDVVYFRLNKSKGEHTTRVTSELLSEIEFKTADINYFWSPFEGLEINVDCLNEEESKDMLKKILSNHISIISVQTSHGGRTKRGKLVDLKIK
jgi:hypothetical protein